MGFVALNRRTFMTAAVALPIVGAASPAAASHRILPEVIDLPPGWRPEGIAIGRGRSFFVGSLRHGGIYRGDLFTGRGGVFVPGRDGGVAVGLEIDPFGRIWACGGATGGASVYDGRSGALLASYAFGGVFVNDAVATRHGVYFTDSRAPFLYRVRGSTVDTIELGPGLGDEGAFNNGIEVLPDGRLLIVQAQADRIFAFDPRDGSSVQLDLGGASVLRGDGMVRRGDALYVCRNFFNTINRFELAGGGNSATLIREITDERFQIPATIDLFGPYVYAVNARFDITPEPDTPYAVIRADA